ncbi:B1 bradykinin receptor [Plakobranchus ocellatus]|uniref:B1 bradykinin receptor n=1 Tax=Plakobranchus ocellatus TaxID=259542 RepID=A0AAV4B2Y1_9GAST|nr:B1 bradykinin receptor [Plakobranchus ocellatus]
MANDTEASADNLEDTTSDPFHESFNISQHYNHFYLLEAFHQHFLYFHGYASIIVSVFGIVTNMVNITVLLAKDMRTPTNYLLACLAVSDILTMIPYIPLAVHFYCPPVDPYTNPEMFSYHWAVFLLVNTKLTTTTHNISIWIAVTLAGFRFTQIRSSCPRGPLAAQLRFRQVRLAAVLVYLLSILIMIPNYMSQEIAIIHNTTAYGIKDSQLGTSGADPTALINILTIAIFAKIVPCLLIILFSGSLIHHMSVKMSQRRRRLSAGRQQVNTTRMLLVVLILFLIVELPQGILLLFSAFMENFHTDFYYYLGEMLDFMALLNNAVNFILYCIMSQQFRDKFSVMYIQPVCHKRVTGITSTSELLALKEHHTQRPPNATVSTNLHDDSNNTSSPLKA